MEFNPFGFFDYIYNWLTNGIYDFATQAIAFLIKWATLAWLDGLIWSISFAWDIAKIILQELNISQYLNNAWGQLPGGVMQYVQFFRVPEVVMNLISGFATRYVLKFIPFI